MQKPWKKICEKEAERWCQGIVAFISIRLGFSFRIESCVGLGVEVQGEVKIGDTCHWILDCYVGK